MQDNVSDPDIQKVRNHTAKILYILLGLNLLFIVLAIGYYTPLSFLMLLLIPLAILIQKGYKQFIIVTMVFLTLVYGYGLIYLGNYTGVIGWAVFMYSLYKAWISEQRFAQLEMIK